MNDLLQNDIMLELGIKDVYNLCQIDKNIYKECSKLSFWKKYYQKNNLPIPSEEINTPELWVLDIILAMRAKKISDALYEILTTNENELEDKYGYGIFEYFEDSGVNIDFNLENVKNIEIFNVEGVDIDLMRNLKYKQMMNFLYTSKFYSDLINEDRKAEFFSILLNLRYEIIRSKWVLYVENIVDFSNYIFEINDEDVYNIIFQLVFDGTIIYTGTMQNPTLRKYSF